ncbi:MAG: multidrug resistance efflux pump [bacterium]|nr:MAG: multidrug resistance efflux pump [bacterium]KAF0149593.1 MAG: multidrug resistance efflux pump [bacterium]KAF0169259.1 MAG: multidrug resistance efflux pump [bacterium]TXT16314.1 MAG: multidrug resistance efflux pump [bacterium]
MNKKKIFLPVLLLALGVGGFAALKATRPTPPVVPPKEPVWRVETLVVSPHTASPVLTLNGRVESPDQTKAAASGVGRVLTVRVREGQRVAAGDPLLELDPRDFLPRVDQARGEVMELDAALRSEELRHKADLDQLEHEKHLLDAAAADVRRFEQLQRESFYSQSAVEQSRSNLARQNISLRTRELAIADHQARLAQIKARLLRARANLDQAQLAATRARVLAPFAGFVAKVEVAVGDQVNNGQSMLTLYPAAALEVRAKLPASQQDEFLAMHAAGGRARATALVGGERLGFRLARLAAAADARGLDGFFVLETPAAAVRVGELVTLEVTRAAVDNAVTVPYVALYHGRQVYRIEDGRLRAMAVNVLGEAGGQPPMLLVSSPDLKKGDVLLATHLPNAVNGLKVEARGK